MKRLIFVPCQRKFPFSCFLVYFTLFQSRLKLMYSSACGIQFLHYSFCQQSFKQCRNSVVNVLRFAKIVHLAKEPRAMNKNFTRDDSLASICFILQSQKLYNQRIHNVTDQPEKTTSDISRSHHWFPREMKSEKRVSAEITY